MSGTINTSVFDSNFQAQPSFASIISACANSPTLTALLNSMPENSIHLGAAGGGTSSSPGANPTITVDPSWLPQSGTSSQETVQVFATTLAHELGHDLVANGYAPLTTGEAPSQYASAALNGEGVALTQEYLVAQEESQAYGFNVTMHSGAAIQAELAAAYAQDGGNTIQFTINAMGIGANWISTQTPSNATGLNYLQYYTDGAALSDCGVSLQTVNWQTMTPQMLAPTEN